MSIQNIDIQKVIYGFISNNGEYWCDIVEKEMEETIKQEKDEGVWSSVSKKMQKHRGNKKSMGGPMKKTKKTKKTYCNHIERKSTYTNNPFDILS